MSFAKQRAEMRRNDILFSAMKVIRKMGFARATMEQIAAELLMTKGSLYYYFKNKEDILLACHQYVLETTTLKQKEILQSTADDFEALYKMVDLHIEAVIEEKDFFNVLTDPKQAYDAHFLQQSLPLRKQYQTTFDELIARGIRNQSFNVDNVFTTRMAILGALNWIQQWYKIEGTISKQQLKNDFITVIEKLLK